MSRFDGNDPYYAAWAKRAQSFGVYPSSQVRQKLVARKRQASVSRAGLYKKRQKPRSRKRPVSFKTWLRDYLSRNRAVRMTLFR